MSDEKRQVTFTVEQIDYLLTLTGTLLASYAERWPSIDEIERRTGDMVADIDNILFAAGSPTHSWTERWDEVRDRTLRLVVDNNDTN
jgi:hypothetical protein